MGRKKSEKSKNQRKWELHMVKAKRLECRNRNTNTKGEVEIVMHVLKVEKTEKGSTYYDGKLYRANLGTGRVSKCPGGDLFLDDTLTSMVVSGNKICILGGTNYRRKISKDKDILNGDHGHLHTGASFLDLDAADIKWKPLPDFLSYQSFYECAAIDGHIFAFGGSFYRSKYYSGEVLSLLSDSDSDMDTNTNTESNWGWRLLPDSPSPDKKPVITDVTLTFVDADNNRILVNNDSTMYAYYPNELRWECMDSKIYKRDRLVAFTDGILLFYSPGHFFAYRIQSNTLVKLAVSIVNFPHSLLYVEYEGLIPLAPPCTLCLASYSPSNVSDTTHLLFIKFRIEPSMSDSGQLLITFVSRHDLQLDCRAMVSSYAPIQVKCEDA